VVGSHEFRAIAFAKMAPNGRRIACVLTTTKASICLLINVLM